MRIQSAFVVIAALCVFLPAGAADRNIDVSVVLDLLDAGVSDASIERYVEKNDFIFELSSRDLKDLKKAGASDALVEFLQSREEEEYGDDAEGYGVTAYPPSYYSYGLYYGYPYYSSGFYYPYYYPYYYGPYFHYSYGYPYYGGRRSGGGSGVVSHWYRNRSGSTGTTTRSSPSRGSSSSHRGSSSNRGGGGGRRR